MKIGLIFGTRPEAIKMAPVYHELKKNNIDVKILATGQHKEMLYQVLELFELKPDYDLQIMKEGQGLSELTSNLISKIDEVIKKEKFDYILVQGDTTSAFVGSLVGFYNKIPVGHIEAGLRTRNIFSPFPEEANRRLIGTIADIHFAPTEINEENLLREGYEKNKILKVGNTVIDALYWVKENKKSDLNVIKEKYGIKNKKYILITMHRRENWGKPMEQVLQGIKRYLKEKDNIYLVFPMHLKPTLILRDTTERPEAINAGTAILVGTEEKEVYKYMKLLEGDLYTKMAHSINPYGDGLTSKKIREYLERIFRK